MIVDEHAESFIVKDATGQALGYFSALVPVYGVRYDPHMTEKTPTPLFQRLRRNVYIDVDGVCLRNASSSPAGMELAPHVFEFLQWATEFHQPHWLTTRDAHGQHEGILRAFRLAIGSPALPIKIEALLKSIKPTTWHGSKVSGIDLGSDFVWIDDQPLRVEIDALQCRNLLSRLIVIDTNKDDDGLLRAIDAINSISKTALT